MRNWLDKEVTWGMFIKLIICINAVALGYLYMVAKIGDYKDQETVDYINYLEHRVEVQEQLLDYYRK